MWFRGTKSGVGIWFVLWGNSDTGYNAELYKTLDGLRSWLIARAFQHLPIVRIARVVLSEMGWEEKECWKTREEFLDSK